MASPMTLSGGALLAGLLGYVAVGPAGLLAGGGGGLPAPTGRTNELGSSVTHVDPEAWSLACRDAGLPDLPDPSGVEVEPIRRLVEASRGWTEELDGDALGRMGEITLALELPQQALDLFAAARELGDERARWAYFLGAAHQQLGHTALALEALSEARELEADYGTTHLRIGALHLELGELEEADASYARCAELQPAPAAGRIGRARVALEQGDPSGALEHLSAAARRTPRDFLLHRLRSRALSQLGREDDAAEAARLAAALPFYRGWLSFDPRLGEAHTAASTQRSLENALSVALAQGELGAARQAAEELLARAPRSPQALAVLARILANAGDLQRASELAARAVELEPRSLERRAAQVEIALAAKDLTLARDKVRAMQELDPRSGLAFQLEGRVRFLQGDPTGARAALERAVELEPAVARHRLMLVDVLTREGRTAEARAQLEALLAREPSNAEARARLEQLE